MISQIRIYTINKGEMDNFLKHFKEDIVSLHQKIGVPIVGTWVNRPQNEFIWVRSYKDKADSKPRTKSFKQRSRPPESSSAAMSPRWKCARSKQRLLRRGSLPVARLLINGTFKHPGLNGRAFQFNPAARLSIYAPQLVNETLGQDLFGR